MAKKKKKKKEKKRKEKNLLTELDLGLSCGGNRLSRKFHISL